MQNRIENHKNQLDFLEFLWDRELEILKFYNMQPTRKGQKNNLALAVKLSSIENRVKKAVIREYFNMFKMLYRIRSIVAYCWDNGERSSKIIKKLYNKD